ncbi:MAG: diaminopimelate epimerase [Pseudomonadota bacterium]
MHGLGNDFMVLDLVTQQWTPEPELIARWGDRHTGVGFDQLLILAPPPHPDVDFEYRVYNSDGSSAEQCGNGIRCVARYVFQNQLSARAELKFQASNSVLRTRLKEGSQVEVDMGPPGLEPAGVPFDPALAGTAHDDGTFDLPVDGADPDATPRVMPVSIGNPHGVMLVENIAEAPVSELGPMLTAHPAFPEQANIGFAQVVDASFLRLRVHERGAGETRACGTGACAAMVAARRLGHINDKVKVSLPGGKVKIGWAGEGSPVMMTGPTARVFDGEVNL